MKNTIASVPPYIGVIILAAGASRRMGSPKQLLKIGQQTLIERTINIASGLDQKEIVVVLGAHAQRIKKVIPNQTGLSIIINKDWQQGMGTTLKTGMQFFLSKEKPPGAVLILVCDQPYLNLNLLKTFIATFQDSNAAIIAAKYKEVKGVPALFSEKLFSKLATLHKDEGARKIIHTFQGKMMTVQFPKGAIDLDTPEAYQTYLKNEI